LTKLKEVNPNKPDKSADLLFFSSARDGYERVVKILVELEREKVNTNNEDY